MTIEHTLKYIEHMLKLFSHPLDRDDLLPERSGGPKAQHGSLTRPTSLGLPVLGEVGADLRVLSRRRQTWLLLRPIVLLGLYVALASAGKWLPALVAILGVYVSAISVLHDLIHRNLGLSEPWNRRWLSLIGMLSLESGHSLQATHLVHHRRVGHADDPEAYVEGLAPWRLIAAVPLYRHNLACWAWRHRPAIRRRIAVEATTSLSAIVFAVVFGWREPVFGVFVAAAVLGSWLFPFVSITWLHGNVGASGLCGTKTIRGRLISALTLGLNFHLEHHLYPSVPTHRLAELSRRIDARLLAAGADPDYFW